MKTSFRSKKLSLKLCLAERRKKMPFVIKVYDYMKNLSKESLLSKEQSSVSRHQDSVYSGFDAPSSMDIDAT